MREDDGGNIYHRRYRRLTSAFGHPPSAIRRFNSILAVVLLPPCRTIAVIGDGSMTAGLAFEGLNHAGHVQNKNLIVAAITLILGTGDFTLKFGQFALGGIGTATFGAILLYALLNRKAA